MADNNSSKTAKTPFFKGVKTEFKKISWPNRPQLVKQTVAVVVVSVALGAIIAIMDLVLQYGVNFLTSM